MLNPEMIEGQMEYKLNIVADKVTLSGHIFSRKILENTFSKHEQIPIVYREFINSDSAINSEDILGFAKFLKISESGEIFIHIYGLSKKFEDIIKKNKDNIEFGFVVWTTINNDQTIDSMVIIAFYPVWKED